MKELSIVPMKVSMRNGLGECEFSLELLKNKDPYVIHNLKHRGNWKQHEIVSTLTSPTLKPHSSIIFKE